MSLKEPNWDNLDQEALVRFTAMSAWHTGRRINQTYWMLTYLYSLARLALVLAWNKGWLFQWYGVEFTSGDELGVKLREGQT
jgi:hypothetical protein